MSHWERCVPGVRTFSLAVAFVAVGCSSTGDRALQDTGSATSDTLAQGRRSSTASGETLTAAIGRKTPKMGKRFAQMIDKEFARYVATLEFVDSLGAERPRKCTTGSGSACRTFIAPEIGADSVTPNNLDGSYVIASLANRGSETEDRYKIPGGTKAYWLVEPDKGSVTRMIVIRADSTSYALEGGPHTYDTCPGHPRRALRADMRGCHPHPTVPGAVDDPPIDVEAWISCLAGCCTG